jgi:hypothetical protein
VDAWRPLEGRDQLPAQPLLRGVREAVAGGGALRRDRREGQSERGRRAETTVAAPKVRGSTRTWVQP